ncbi:GNAT family N-acetyltransferase [Nostoc sp. 3335mG]|nr:GNAT family N-acetyltransferase [Nostoc sp. 3335mG]
MLERPRPAPLPASPLRLVRWERPGIDRYRALFRRIGGPWLWFSRLVMADDALTAILHDERVRIWAVVDRAGIEVGMLELDDRKADECELSYVGLIPELAGQGHGRWLMAHALALAWGRDVRRVWVHTCTLDHPRALAFYRRSGFVPYQRTIETFADPRAIGILPADVAPHYPLLASRR